MREYLEAISYIKDLSRLSVSLSTQGNEVVHFKNEGIRIGEGAEEVYEGLQ